MAAPDLFLAFFMSNRLASCYVVAIVFIFQYYSDAITNVSNEQCLLIQCLT